MSEPLTNEAINDLRQRILSAQNGECEMPSREELLAAYSHLRTARSTATAASKSKRAKKAPVNLPTDLNDLFK